MWLAHGNLVFELAPTDYHHFPNPTIFKNGTSFIPVCSPPFCPGVEKSFQIQKAFSSLFLFLFLFVHHLFV